jgi:23S rRNA pseudouridine1911/1915/1917 synthase
MPAPIDLTVQSPVLVKRIDAYLAAALSPDFSREEIKSCLKDGKVFLNGRMARPSDAVKEGDRITGELVSEKIATAQGEDIPVNVVFEDDWFLVVEKPAGLVVHPGAGNRTGTLVNALLGRKTPLSSMGGAMRPGIVHRLDKETSGLLLVAKTNVAHRKLQAQFAARSLSKVYIALVRGRVEFEEGRVEAPMERDVKVRRRMDIARAGEGRDALTHYRVLGRYRFATLVEVKIVTGRTHQIRVHMRHLGHPVVGDTLYGKTGEAKEPRLALHAAKIEFLHPKTGKIMRFESPVPPEMKAMIEKAKEAK